jgi:hypothetical protein
MLEYIVSVQHMFPIIVVAPMYVIIIPYCLNNDYLSSLDIPLLHDIIMKMLEIKILQ